MESEKILLGPGTLLLSEPFMQDPLFGRSVVLLCHHDEEGSLGLILNKRIDNPFDDSSEHPLTGFSFFCGGPVDKDSLFFVHRLPELKEAVPLREGLFWQGDFDDLLIAIENGEFTENNGRMMMGYAGWGAGQLEEELENEDWMVYNGSFELIFQADEEKLWKEILSRMGPYYKMVSNYPTDPGLN